MAANYPEKPPSWWDQNRHLQPRPIPVKYSTKMGDTARVPWESRPIDASARAPRRIEDEIAIENIPLGGGESEDAASDIASSSWTGRRTLREQVAIIQTFAPLALEGVDQLASAIESRRLNDPVVQDALAALKELHLVLGEMIEAAEAKRSMKRLWKRFEASKAKLTNAVWDGAQVMLVAPTLAMGTATFLSLLSGFPITEGMVTALCAASMTKDALLTVAKRR